MPLVKPPVPVLQRSLPLANGLLFALPLFSPNWIDLISGNASGAFSGLSLSNSPMGAGALIAAGANYATYKYNAQPPTKWSMHANVVLSSLVVSTGTICGFNQSSDGSNSTFDRSIGGGTSSGFFGYLYDGNQKSTSPSGSAVAGGIYDLTATCDGSTLKLYENGALLGSIAVANGGYTSYATPVYFGVGRMGTGGPIGGTTINGTILCCECWTRALSIAEVELLAFDPSALYRNKSRWWNFGDAACPSMLPLLAAGAIALERNPAMTRRKLIGLR